MSETPFHQLVEIWTAPDNERIRVYSDGNQFLAVINAGVGWETYLSVGYSSPNMAMVAGAKPEQPGPFRFVGWDERHDACDRVDPTLLAPAIQAAYEKIEHKPLMEMLPALLSLAEAANGAYNQQLNRPPDIGDPPNHIVLPDEPVITKEQVAASAAIALAADDNVEWSVKPTADELAEAGKTLKEEEDLLRGMRITDFACIARCETVLPGRLPPLHQEAVGLVGQIQSIQKYEDGILVDVLIGPDDNGVHYLVNARDLDPLGMQGGIVVDPGTPEENASILAGRRSAGDGTFNPSSVMANFIDEHGRKIERQAHQDMPPSDVPFLEQIAENLRRNLKYGVPKEYLALLGEKMPKRGPEPDVREPGDINIDDPPERLKK